MEERQMTLTRWRPVGDFAAVEIDRLNRMFEAALAGDALPGGGWMPAADIYETTDKDIVVKIDLPQIKREDIKVSFENNVLSVEGERRLEKDVKTSQFHRVERGHGAFHRSFAMPATVDAGKAAAAFADGVLTITLPRREEARPRQIEVNG
jgi:HSP20 family protein